MRLVLGFLPQMLVMAAIVATALYVPIGAIAVALAWTAFDVTPEALASFGGRLAPVEGLLAWWLILLVPALAYAAFAMPWHADHA